MARQGMETESFARLIARSVSIKTAIVDRPYFLSTQRNVLPETAIGNVGLILHWLGDYPLGHQVRWLIYRGDISVGCYTKIGPQLWSYHSEPAKPIDLQA